MVARKLFLGLLATICDQNTLFVLEDGRLLLIGSLGLVRNTDQRVKALK